MPGPDGRPLTVLQSTFVSRDYTKECAACGKGEGDEGVHLRTCSACKRCRYCSVDCQVGGLASGASPAALAGFWMAGWGSTGVCVQAETLWGITCS